MVQPLLATDQERLDAVVDRLRSERVSALLTGDATASLAALPEQIAQAIVTSPPYWGVRDYGIEGQQGHEQGVNDYIYGLVRTFRAARRVLRDDGTLWLNLGDGYTSGGRTTRALDKKNRNRAPQVRPPTPFRLKPKDLLLLSAGLVRALQQPWLACPECGHEDHATRFGWMPSGADICPACAAIVKASVTEPGWYVRQEIVWEKPNCQPESVKDRATRAHEHIWLLSKSARYKFNHRAIRGPNDRNIRTVWRVHTQQGRYGHVAPFPEALAAACIALSTNPGDLVLDPFLGSGTTAAVAHKLGRRYCGIELNPDYTQIAATRINNAAPSHDHKATLIHLLHATNLIAA